LSIDHAFTDSFTIDYGEFLCSAFDYINPVFAKLSNNKRNPNTASMMSHRETMLGALTQRDRDWDMEPDILDFLATNNPQIIPDYCVSFRTRDNQCDAGYGQLSLDAFGRIATCPYNPSEYDASTPEKFTWYLEEVVTRAHHITGCNMIEPPASNWNRSVWLTSKYQAKYQSSPFDIPPIEIRENIVALIEHSGHHNRGVGFYGVPRSLRVLLDKHPQYTRWLNKSYPQWKKAMKAHPRPIIIKNQLVTWDEIKKLLLS